MNYMNKLVGFSLIMCAAFSSCSDEMENGGNKGTGDKFVTFTVNTQNPNHWSDGNDTRSVSGEKEEPIEMESEVYGLPVLLTTEVTDGFPGDNQLTTRGTQITEDNKNEKMKAFRVTALTDINSEKLMIGEKVTKDDSGDTWSPEGKFIWPYGKNLSFYAWYPCDAEGLVVDNSTLDYTVPDDVSQQVDLMTAQTVSKSEVESVPLTFNHLLTAVKISVSVPSSTIKSISIKGVKYMGSIDFKKSAWTTVVDDTKDFTLLLDNQQSETGEDQTFFMMPQTLPTDAKIEVVVNNGTSDYAMSISIGDTDWVMGKTYTYSISARKLSATAIFYADVNGVDGNPYTSHNISANGEPYVLSFIANAVSCNLNIRFVYELTENGQTTYESFREQNYNSIDRDGKYEWGVRASMSPMFTIDKSQAKKEATPFLIQVKISSKQKIYIMTPDPDDPDTQRIYDPSTDADTWYTIWRGTMYPPNYVLTCGSSSTTIVKNYISRANIMNGTSYVGTYATMAAAAKEYWEVDPNHPKYGKGKWALSDTKRMYADDETIFCNITMSQCANSWKGGIK